MSLTTHDATATVTVQLRYFAAAAEAAGAPSEEVTLPVGATAEDLLGAIGAERPELRRVLDISSLLVDGVVREDRSLPLQTAGTPTALRVDVLPPFAGG
ncbi:MoaD/ThiS family protein [Georgenia yuyongxinii]|uniref:MoaD/ThiS family protein n=1 Tax=Georgenia yuyongxinii TaxID=2589797 RepID=A0A552WM50_9MICO|nr:MoaD/ThiS family protein [Georgenia yuyongxinii]TRW43840.1 MoaD/ThiS family protein [Georgenia yuyongxinii]